MSKFLLKDKNGSYRKKIESSEMCKYMINGICCNENSKYLGCFPKLKCNCDRSCNFYEKEIKIKGKNRGKAVMRLTREEYKMAEGCLKRYNYNCVTILNIRADVMSIKAVNYDGMPKAKYNISDSVSNSIIQLQENKYLQVALKECKAVEQALLLVGNDSKFIFDQLYIKSKTKWEIISTGISERTFFRRKKDLIFAVHKELKKMESFENGRKLA